MVAVLFIGIGAAKDITCSAGAQGKYGKNQQYARVGLVDFHS